MTTALTRHLKDFGTPSGDRRGARTRGNAAGSDGSARQPETDPEAIRAAARDEGYQAATVVLESRHEQALAEAQAAHETACAELRQHLEIEAAETIGSRFSALISDLGRQIGDEAARVLAPFVTAEVELRLAERFAEEMRSVLASEDVVAVTVSGPPNLFARVKKHPALANISLTHVESDAVDLKAEIGPRILATRMSAFAETLAEALP